MIQLGPCELTGTYGPVSSGKTFLISQWLKTQNRYVRFDVTGETCDDPTVEHIWSNPAALWERLKANPYYFRIAYHPGPELETDFNYALRCLWRVKKVHKLLVCDEFHEVCGVNDTPGYVKTMMRYARHNHFAFIGASQRIPDVSKLFTTNCRTTVIFWTQEGRDLDAITDRWGKSAAYTVANLRPLIFNDETKITKQIPQCLVCKKGEAPKVFDFAKDAYVSNIEPSESPDSEVPTEEIPSEDSGSEDIPAPDGPGPGGANADVQ